jgi:WD40 repeat protein
MIDFGVPNNSVVPKTWAELPNQCSLQVFGYLSPMKVGACRLVCKQWDQFLNSEYAWQKLSRDHFPSMTPGVIKNLRGYVDLDSNLSKGVCSMRTLQGDKKSNAIFALAVSGDKLFTGSDDNMIEVWDLSTNTCTASFEGHEGQVNSLVVKGGKLFSGSDDSTVKVWDQTTLNCTATLSGHTNRVGPLAVEGEELFSGSLDKTIKVWDLRDNTCKATLKATLSEHTANVNSLLVEGGKLFSCSADSTIKIWDLSTRTCTDTLGAHATRLVSDGKKLFLGCWDTTIKILDLDTRAFIASLSGHADTPRVFTLDCGKLFSGSNDKTIKIWDLATPTCIATLDAGPLYALTAKDGKLFSGSSENTIKIWDFTASHAEIFTEIAAALENKDQATVESATQRFLKMPEAARNKIYGELHKIIKPRLKHDYWRCGEDAFHGRNKQSATGAQKAQAIRNYLG